jgi:polyphosphate kinase 2
MPAMAKRTANGTLKLDTATYEKELFRLQAELVTMQQWVIGTGSRLVVLFEGRDAAGKGSAIKRVAEYLNPRVARIVALPAPSDRDKTQWYFQRYVPHLPAAGEIVLFDRSWYNRAGVERVMGFCSDEQYWRFLRQAPVFEQMLVEEGIMLRKYWFSVSDVEQEARFRSRPGDPMRRWKLSPMDMESITRWEDYSRAKDVMMQFTDTEYAPWYVVESEDKRASRINVIKHILASVPYEDLHPKTVEIPSRPVAVGYHRPPRESNRYVPDHAHTLPIVTPPAPKKASAKGASKKDEGKKNGTKHLKTSGDGSGDGHGNGPSAVAMTSDAAVVEPHVSTAASGDTRRAFRTRAGVRTRVGVGGGSRRLTRCETARYRRTGAGGIPMRYAARSRFGARSTPGPTAAVRHEGARRAVSSIRWVADEAWARGFRGAGAVEARASGSRPGNLARKP